MGSNLRSMFPPPFSRDTTILLIDEKNYKYVNFDGLHQLIFCRFLKKIKLIRNTKISLNMDNKEFKPAEQYTAPSIEVIEIELTQNILQGSGGGNAPGDFGGEDW